MTPKEEQKPVEPCSTDTSVAEQRLAHTDLLPAECSHAWPNMTNSTQRKCMLCGAKECDVMYEDVGKMFKEASDRLEKKGWASYPPKTYEDAMSALETEQTMHKAWRKRAEEAESKLLTRKADCHEELEDEVEHFESCECCGNFSRMEAKHDELKNLVINFLQANGDSEEGHAIIELQFFVFPLSTASDVKD